MSSYFGHTISPIPIISVSRWVRYWLTLRLYRSKIVYRDNRPYLKDPLTLRNKAVIFTLHLFILGGLAAGIIASFVGTIRLIYG